MKVKEIVTENVDDVSVSIWPNPTKGNFILLLTSNNNGNVNIRIVNQLGQEKYNINTGKFNKNLKKTFDFTNMQSGLYFIIISTEKEKLVKKLILR